MESLQEDLVSTVDLLNASDDDLVHINQDGLLALNVEEMRAVQQHFVALGRNPTDVEVETLAQTWSEHCKHKVFNGIIDYTGEGRTERIDNLFAQTIRKATEDIRRQKGDKDWCVSVFIDNAGIIEFDAGNSTIR